MEHIEVGHADRYVLAVEGTRLDRWLAQGFQLVPRNRLLGPLHDALHLATLQELSVLWRALIGCPLPENVARRVIHERLEEEAQGRYPNLLLLTRFIKRNIIAHPTVLELEAPAADAPPGHIMWIGFELVDQEGTPIAGHPFLLTAPDGQQSTQRLDERGLSRTDPTLDGPFGFKLMQSEPKQQALRDYVDLEVVDGVGAPIVGAQYQVLVGGTVVRAGAVDRDGRGHIEDLPPGPYEIVLPGFEPGAVTLNGAAAHAASGASRPASTYRVKPGDTLAKIAKAHGVKSGKALYDAPENADLRKKRPNLNRIRPGDQVKIPAAAAAALAAEAGDVVQLVVQRTDDPVVRWNVSFPADLVEQLPDDTVLELSCQGGATDTIPIAEGKVEEDVVQFDFAWSPPGSKISLVARTAKQSVTLIDGAVPEQGAPWQDSLHALLSASKPEPLAALEHVADAGDYEGEVGLLAEAFDFVETDEVIV